MAFGTLVTDGIGTPISSVYVPGSTFIALSGSTLTNTDGNNNVSTPANLNLLQIGSIAAQMGGSDGVTAANVLEVLNGLYNGSTIDQRRGNQDNIALINSVATTTTQTSADQTNYNARGLYVIVDVTAGSTLSLTPEIDLKDPVSGKYRKILLAGSALTGVTTATYLVYPGANTTVPVGSDITLISSVPLPRTWRVVVTHGNGNAATYKVAVCYIV
jgi:hypothetical protein